MKKKNETDTANTNLIDASIEGDLEQVKYCLKNGANIHIFKDKSLRRASYYGHLEVVKYLVENGADIHAENDRAIYCASYGGYIEVVKYLISKGADSSKINKEECDKDILEYLQYLNS